MPETLQLHADRLFPADPVRRDIARRLYQRAAPLPIVSPHGHTDAAWFAADAPFRDAAELLIKPDHYVFRMLYSLGVPLDRLGIAGTGSEPERDNREVWRCFAAHYHAFRGTPTRLWLDHVFAEVFELQQRLGSKTADAYYDAINESLRQARFRPRALFERFKHRGAGNHGITIG